MLVPFVERLLFLNVNFNALDGLCKIQNNMVTSILSNGRQIEFTDGKWIYSDTKEIYNSKVEAKFKCSSVEHFEIGKKVKAQPVISGSEENKSFAKYTPSVTIEMYIDNETAAADFFQPGVEFYVTFSSSKPE